MAENIRIDSHKLIYHPEVVARWMKGENIYPIELEITLTGACNHRCIFCAYAYRKYNSDRLDTELLLDNLREVSSKGVRSVVYAGDGEPLLHKDAPDIINKTKEFGLDVAMSTNGVLFTPEISKECLKSLTWMRFSTAGIKEDTYSKIHRGKSEDLQKVLFNMNAAVECKKKNQLKTTIGVQLLLLPENKEEVVQMTKEMKRIGVDYFTIKPFSHNPQNEHLIQVDYKEMMEIEKEIKNLETEDFKIYFRAHTMKKLEQSRCYTRCWALPFMVYIDEKGSVYPCGRISGRVEFQYGNLYERSFCEIWESEQKREAFHKLFCMDLDENCGKVCRMDEMNRYLNELKHPSEHVNFI